MENRLKYLFEKYENKQCTKEELKEFFQLLETNTYNNELRDLLDESFDRYTDNTFSEQQKEHILKNVIKHSRNKTNVIRFRLIRKYAIAISIAIAFCGILIYTLRENIVPEKVQIVQHADTLNTNKLVFLPDSSFVVLKDGATISYPIDYGKKQRLLDLEGEAYFHVQKNTTVPFIVRTSSGITTRVLGTKFNVKSDEGRQVIVTVTEGRVQVEADQKVLNILEANQQLSYNIQTKNYIERPVNASKVVSWQNEDLYFNDITIAEVSKQLMDRYNVSILINDEKLASEHISVVFYKEESLDDVLKVICTFFNAHYKIDKYGIVTLSKTYE